MYGTSAKCQPDTGAIATGSVETIEYSTHHLSVDAFSGIAENYTIDSLARF